MIRAGDRTQARGQLILLKGKKLPRELVVELAGLARRAGDPYLALYFLGPVVRSPVPIHPPTSVAELAVYAASLLRVDAVQEAKNLLRSLSSVNHPEVLLYQSFACFAEWEHLLAVPILRKYLRHPLITPYQRIVGQVNLSLALLMGNRLLDAKEILTELLTVTEQQNHIQLYGNSAELRARVAISENDFALAETFLQKANGALVKAGGDFEFLLRKWRTVSLVLAKPKVKNLTALLEIRREAIKKGEWEIARECDLYQVLVTCDEYLYNYLAYGSPYAGFRRRLNSLLIHPLALRKQFDYSTLELTLAAEGMDLSRGGTVNARSNAPGTAFIPQGVLHRTLTALASDFYKPQSLGGLFVKVYEDEYFDPESSFDRVTQSVVRLREWFNKCKIPLTVKVKHGEYYLIFNQPYFLRLRNKKPVIFPYAKALEQLRLKWPYQSFSSGQANVLLKTRPDSLLREAFKKGLIYRSGKGRSTLYRFKK